MKQSYSIDENNIVFNGVKYTTIPLGDNEIMCRGCDIRKFCWKLGGIQRECSGQSRADGRFVNWKRVGKISKDVDKRSDDAKRMCDIILG